nr:MAG TPA: hypothetical protein [Caudoviricetes sp.]
MQPKQRCKNSITYLQRSERLPAHSFEYLR